MVNFSRKDVLEFPQNKGLPDRGKSKQDPENQENETPDDNEELFRQMQEWLDDARERSSDWRSEAKESDEFSAGWQYDAKDINVAERQRRPLVTFDRIGRNVAAVCGLEINNRQKAATFPREEGDVEEAEIGSNILSWIDDETGAPNEDGEAFRHMVVRGVGCTDTNMNYLEYGEVNGLSDTVCVSTLLCYWDPNAKRQNLTDRTYDFVVKTMPISEARRLCPGHDDVMLHAGWAGIDDDLSNAGIKIQSRRYEQDRAGERAKERARSRVTLIECQWREVVNRFMVEDRQTGSQRDMSPEVGKLLVETLPERYAGVERPTYVYYRAILGGQILKKIKLDAQKGFTREYMTGYRDETRGMWYGLVRAMKDPQRAANSLYSQSVAMMKSGTKNGWIMEQNAVRDIRDFETNQAKHGGNLIVSDGALSGAKIRELQHSPPPTHTHELLGMSLDQVQASTGIPLEMIATSNGSGPAQTALLEDKRRQTGITLLANFFNAKRMHLQRKSKLILRYVHEFMRDGRLMRVMNEGQAKYVPLWLEDEDITTYDIVVDSNPTSADAREKAWASILGLMQFPAFQQLPPEVLVKFLEFVPNFPAKLTREISEVVERMAEPTPEKQRQDELRNRAQEAEVAKTEGQAMKERTAAELNKAKVEDMGGRLALDATEQMRETALAAATPGTVPFREFG